MESGTEMPRYKCHKEVHALKIEKSVENPDSSIDLFFEDEGFAPINIEYPDVVRFRDKMDHGYLVVYEKDGYRSWSPTKAFEEGYTPIAEVENLQPRIDGVVQKLEWIRNDIAYKAPEQLTAGLFADYLDMLNIAIMEKE